MYSKNIFSDAIYDELSQAFRYIDKNRDGMLDVEDISNLFMTLGIGVNKNNISVAIRSLSDSNDSIGLPLFIELLGRALENPGGSQELRTLFRIVDRNGDGYLDPEEISFRMSKTVGPITKEETSLLLDSIHMDDGPTVNCEEFGALLRSRFSKSQK
ncbi:unnamed protein product [Heterobilharzia americana]|nr:unnamed protein product [Heterobilharzia americana]